MTSFTPNTIYTADAAKLLPSWPTGSVDLLLTDPPYGNDTTYGTGRRRIIGDEHPLLGLQVVASCYRLMKRNATAYVFCGAKHIGFIEDFLMRYTRFRIRELLIWDKRQMGLGLKFRRSFECILVLEKGKPVYRGSALPTLLSVTRVSAALHPHTKPLPLLERLIAASSDLGDVVLDPFAGSGSTLVAAARLGRRYVGVEVAPEYAEIARVRVATESAA